MKLRRPTRKTHSEGLLKWTILVLLGIMLYIAGSRQAFHQRGYEAIGGEMFLLALPAAYLEIEQMVKEIIEDIKEDFGSSAHEQ